MDKIERILTLLQSEDPRQRESAFNSIPAHLPDQVTLALIDTLRDDNLALRQRSVETLIEKGADSLPALIEALRIDDHDIQFNDDNDSVRIASVQWNICIATVECNKKAK